MVPAAKKLWGSFSTRVQRLDGSRQHVDQLHKARELSRQAADQMYESLFLASFTAFETYLEEVFLTHLVRTTKSSTSKKTVPRVGVNSRIIAREMVVGPGRKYADWFPFPKTIDRARLFFRGGRPFTSVDPAQLELLKKSHLIRNAIAHHSRYSDQIFQKHVIDGAVLPPRERRPGGFLRGVAFTPPPTTRYENYVTTFLAVAKYLS